MVMKRVCVGVNGGIFENVLSNLCDACEYAKYSLRIFAVHVMLHYRMGIVGQMC